MELVEQEQSEAVVAGRPVSQRYHVRLQVALHVKDLFMGRRGQSEVGTGSRDAVFLPLVEVSEACLRHTLDVDRPDGEQSVTAPCGIAGARTHLQCGFRTLHERELQNALSWTRVA